MPMNFNKNELTRIAEKVVAGNASPEEIEFLHQYYDVFDKETDITEEMSQEEREFLKKEIMADIQANINLPAPNKEFQFIHLLKIAASIILVVALGYIGFQSLYHKNSRPNTDQTVTDVLPGGNNAVLTLADGSTYVLNQMAKKILVKKGNLKIEKTKEGQLVFSVINSNSVAESALNTITTPNGGQYEIILPDGSKVLLNAASSLKFPNSFNGNKREVQLTGEGYFEIAHLAEKPFYVKSEGTTVQVLGTHFNVNAYQYNQIKTTLLEGSVKLSSNAASIRLVPGEQGLTNESGSIQTRKVNADKEVSWRKGWFNFDGSSIVEVMEEISRWYDVEVIYEGKIPHKEITGKVPRNAKLSVVLEMLRYSDLQFEVNSRKITIK